MGAVFYLTHSNEIAVNSYSEENTEYNAQAVEYAYYKRLLADPATGEMPPHIHNRELAYSQLLPYQSDIKRSEKWIQRGPDNLGGRTRAIGINLDNVNEILAGAATGGIFKSTDGGKTWNKMVCPLYSITCMVQDQRLGKRNIWYAGTGELSGSSGSGAGAYLLGGGILKSTDGGNTWTVLAATAGTSTSAFDTEFDGVWNIVIDTSNHVQDELYAATYASIYKSINGGTTWQIKRSGSGSASYYTDVAITSKGIVYATLSSESSQKGIWRSTDGDQWVKINPTNFPATFGRITIGIAPSDENQVYFMAAVTTNSGLKSTNFQGVDEWNSLWKYNYLSGNGSATGGEWFDRSANLPAKGGDFGYFSTQGGYDLYVRVKPDNPNVVFIGCTNLWRSTDGFTSTNNTDWIGGYAVNTVRPNYQMYANHHPDQHNFIFHPGSVSKVYSTHDGGISYTNDVMAANVQWEAKNDRYITSQFYTVAIDHSKMFDHKVIGGLQDNGTHFINQYGLGAWHMSMSSDGSFCTIKNNSNEIYASTQQGRIVHLEVDNIGRSVKYARIDPSQLYRSDYDFINPFSIDPNDQKILYLPAKRRLFRNTDIDARPLTTDYDSTRWTTPLWEEMTQCIPPTGSEFSAITVSKIQKNVLYYATSTGNIYRVRNANSGQPSPQKISGINFEFGNINCIALDPLDSNSIMVVYSNYGIRSLFHTQNGGVSWQNVSGNLEQNITGTGDGPSCRWAAVMPLSDGKRSWFVGTSTGLYATTHLTDSPTVWIKQSPEGIGSSIVTMIETRPEDYYLVAATHGAGMYSANISSEWQTTSIQAIKATGKFEFSVYPNPVSNGSIGVVFTQPIAVVPNFTLYNINGQKQAVAIDGNYLSTANSMRLKTNTLAPGIYWLVVQQGQQSSTQKIIVLK